MVQKPVELTLEVALVVISEQILILFVLGLEFFVLPEQLFLFALQAT